MSRRGPGTHGPWVSSSTSFLSDTQRLRSDHDPEWVSPNVRLIGGDLAVAWLGWYRSAVRDVFGPTGSSLCPADGESEVECGGILGIITMILWTTATLPVVDVFLSISTVCSNSEVSYQGSFTLCTCSGLDSSEASLSHLGEHLQNVPYTVN